MDKITFSANENSFRGIEKIRDKDCAGYYQLQIITTNGTCINLSFSSFSKIEQVQKDLNCFIEDLESGE